LWNFTAESFAIAFIEIRVGNIFPRTTHDNATLSFGFLLNLNKNLSARQKNGYFAL
jgi:hypothetical protein